MRRQQRKLIADETLEILDRGMYMNSRGEIVSIENSLRNAAAGTHLIQPHEFDSLILPTETYETKIEVYNETTFGGCQALLADNAEDVCCLNFASAKNPGGGFRGGSQAQEEALSRASGLYKCLLEKGHDYYMFHRRKGSNCLYSHHMIYSPQVPVFRNDEDILLDQPWVTSIITSAAVNRGALRTRDQKEMAEPVMKERIERVIKLALAKGHKSIVLGAWGTGVFRNDPSVVARLFEDCLLRNESIRGKFDRVRFSVLDLTSTLRTFSAFNEIFAGNLV